MKYTKKPTKRAFTLIELLIVIAIIGILFVVLVSKVDFATDKAKASGVQTDFRSFQMAFDTVSKENAGFASLGWDTGDENGNRKRDSYDEGDTNTNNIMESTETWTGHKVPGESWTGTYTLLNPKEADDTSAFKLLEDKVNANLDPKLHITITPDKGEDGKLTGNATIAMANSARDPWGNEYHGVYITNALNDGGMDRGAFIMYSNGANGKWGSQHSIANGNVSITVPGNNVRGKDDYSMSVFYSYANGYGEIAVVTTGFSNNQKFLGGAPAQELDVVFPEAGTESVLDPSNLIEFTVGKFEANTSYTPGEYTTVEYEVLKIRERKPVANSQTISFTGYPDTVNLATLNPLSSTYKSEYVVYAVYKASNSNSNGYIQVHCDQRYITNAVDDTLDNAVYFAAYMKKATNITYNVAKWNGSEYIQMDCGSQINTVTEFTETYIDIEYKVVEVSKPSSNTNYVYIPSGSMQALEGMTWSEWIASEYNTLDYVITSVFDADYNTINLGAAIVSGQKYGFVVTEKISLPWPIRYNSMELENHPNAITSPIDGEIKLVKLCDYVPTKEDMESLHVYAMPMTESVYMGWELEEYESIDGISGYNYMWHDWNSGYGIGLIVVDTPNAQIAEIGLTIEEPGLYILVGWSIVPGTDIIIDAPMSPEPSEMNEYGFFYDYEYYACDYESNMASLVFREDGSVDLYYEEQSQSFPAGSAIYGMKSITQLADWGVGIVSPDGTQIYLSDIDLRISIIGMSKKR